MCIVVFHNACAVMAATSFIALAYFLLFNVLYCRSCISTAIYTSVIEGERKLSYLNVLKCPNLTLQTKGLITQTKKQTPRRIRFPLSKWSKHGYTCLSTPERSYVADLTIFMDVHPDPGWNPTKSAPKQQFCNFPANSEQHANEFGFNRPLCFGDQLRYLAKTTVNRSTTTPYYSESHHTETVSYYERRKYRRSRGGKKFKRKLEIQKISTKTLVTSQRTQHTSRGHRNHSNLIAVNMKDVNIPFTTSSSATKNNPVFCPLNAKSLNNKSDAKNSNDLHKTSTRKPSVVKLPEALPQISSNIVRTKQQQQQQQKLYSVLRWKITRGLY